MGPEITIIRYDAAQKPLWDDFVAQSKNGSFLFFRDYMEYHSNRFPDFSLMFFNESNTLVGLMPATISGSTLLSHAGLTFGGILSDARMKTPLMLKIFEALREHASMAGIKRVIYKAIPHIYHLIPAEEDLYALHRQNARLIRRDVSSAINGQEKLSFSRGRKYEIKRAQKDGLQIESSTDYKSFMEIEAQVLSSKYDVGPVHTADEMQMLAGRFPENIKLFTAYRADAMLGGVIVYESRNVAHTQYIAANEEGRRVGALDLILSYLISDYYSEKKYFDFGISTENEGHYLNVGLIENKESFGARAVVQDFYEIAVDSD